MNKSLSIVGAGKVGSTICKALFKVGYNIELVVSLNGISAQALAKEVDARWSKNSSQLITSALVIISVPDNCLKLLASKLNLSQHSLLVHTAGSYGTEVFDGVNCKGKGVLYPFQSFSYSRDIDLLNVPFFIDADNQQNLTIIEKYASQLSNFVYQLDSDKRKIMHISGVFVNNFVTHLCSIGVDLLDREGLSKEILTPLINETIEKIITLGPEQSQTGPAIRNDQNTIEKHLDLLSFSPELKDIYKSITKSIINKVQN